ncbi:hypothetical protein LDENG_00106140 [Lucifuga dentata]|nr:hypothetical protein LDENG_00106140 [Lucifuga dentata]
MEYKFGMKTPETLLIWMKDAADCEDFWSSGDVGEHRDSLSDKIRNLKQEMRWLRSADVSILRQLVAMHEGIEAMRWLMEERGTLASRDSSLTGSLSSLVTVEGPAASRDSSLTGSLSSLVTVEGPASFMSPFRESPDLICLQDLSNTSEEESADASPHNADDVSSYFNMQNYKSAEERTPTPSSPTFEVIRSTRGRHALTQFSPANANSLASASLQGPVSFKDFKTNTDPIRSALFRSSMIARKGTKGGTGTFVQTEQTGEAKTEQHLPQESFRKSQNNIVKEEMSMPGQDKVLLQYDVQWWVESHDDVTFL